MTMEQVKNYVLEKLILERPLEETPETNAGSSQTSSQPAGANSNGKGTTAFRPSTRAWQPGVKHVVEILCNDQVSIQ